MLEIFCDFDGTLTNKDTLVVLLDKFVGREHWYAIEERALAGEIPERESLQAELTLITTSDEELLNVLKEEIQPAEGVADLIGLVRERNWRLTVLSGGLIRFAGALWRQWGYAEFPLYANDHTLDAEGRMVVIPAPFPHLKNLCNHCKTYHLQQAKLRGSRVVYVGDGLTDRCPAEYADICFAKDNLLDYLSSRKLPLIPYESLLDVVNHMQFYR